MNKKLLLNTSVVMASFLSFVSASFAWFIIENDVEMEGGKGYTAASYFYSGDGSADDPFVINDPIHLYNLAWLQYLGEFNKKDEINGYQQYHFVLGADIDMKGLVLPPIGTTDNPFVGTFDGTKYDENLEPIGQYTISNLVVSNKIGNAANQISKKPLKVDASSFSGVNIVGMFGVVGNYNKFADFNTFTPELKNFYISDATVKSELTATLAGIAAGYVDAKMTGVGVDGSAIDIASGSTAYDSTLTSKISDYTLVGYCTEKYRNRVTIVDNTVFTPTRDTSYYVYEGDGGQQSGWGGSIDMMTLHTRLRSFSQSATTLNYQRQQISRHYDDQANPTNEIATINNARRYYNANRGQVYFADNGGQYLYLLGGRRDIDEYYDSKYVDYAGSRLSFTRNVNGRNRTYYLTANGTTLGITEDINAAKAFSFSNASGSGTIRVNIDNQIYSLYCANNGSGTTLSTTNSRNFSIDNNGRIYYNRSNNYGDYYLSITNQGAFSFVQGNTNADVVSLTRTNFTERVHYYQIDNSRTTLTYNNTNATYIPLNVDTSYNVNDNNTGYIMSGCYNNDTDSGWQNGDVRVSYYSRNTYLSASRIGNSTTAWDVLTRTAKSNGFKRVSDEYNSSAGNSNGLNGYTKMSQDALGLKKYSDSRRSLQNVLGTNVYGLHFMNAAISKDNIVVAPRAHINGVDYTNYQMPGDSIDFNLKEKGIINFFAGSYYYYRAPDNFFSLHQVFRNADNTIKEIREIKEIYEDNVKNHSCVYKYKDGTYSRAYSFDKDVVHTELSYTGNYPSGYSLVFDTDWITRPTIVNRALYYYEIPMNDGEFALGAADTGTGAYLLYLDIAANAQYVTSTVIKEQYRTVLKSYVCPYGVSLVMPGGAVNDADSIVAIAVAPSFSGSLSLDASATLCTYGCSSTTGVSIGYISEGTSLRKEGSSTDAVANPDSLRDETTTKTTIIDINTTTLEQTKTEKVQTTLDIGSGSSTSSTVNITRVNENGEDITESLTADNISYFTNKYSTLTFDNLSNVLVKFKAVYLSPTEAVLHIDLVLGEEISAIDDYPYKIIDSYDINFEITAGEGPINVKIISVGATYEVYINDKMVAQVEVPDQVIVVTLSTEEPPVDPIP